MSLTHRQALFVDAYCSNGHNATQAAITAGYSIPGARTEGSKVLAIPAVKRMLAERMAKIIDTSHITVDRTLREVARIAYLDPRRFFDKNGKPIPIHELDDDEAACVSSIEIDTVKDVDGVVTTIQRIKLADKGIALEKLMKFHKLYQDVAPHAAPPIDLQALADVIRGAVRDAGHVIPFVDNAPKPIVDNAPKPLVDNAPKPATIEETEFKELLA